MELIQVLLWPSTREPFKLLMKKQFLSDITCSSKSSSSKYKIYPVFSLLFWQINANEMDWLKVVTSMEQFT